MRLVLTGWSMVTSILSMSSSLVRRFRFFEVIFSVFATHAMHCIGLRSVAGSRYCITDFLSNAPVNQSLLQQLQTILNSRPSWECSALDWRCRSKLYFTSPR